MRCILGVFVVAVPGLLLLAACGGGGGGGGGLTLTQQQLSGDLEAGKAVAGSIPKFGSVTQSSNFDGSNVTTDSAQTSFDGSVLTLTVTDGNGDEDLSLNSRDHTYYALSGTALADDEDAAAGISVGAWVLARQTSGTVTVAVAYTAWEDADSTNYLAGGYWVTASDDGVGAVDLDLGAFFDWGDGSGFNHGVDGWTKPTSGTANYTGAAQGSYMYEGTEPENNDLGIWTGGLKLDANFSADTIDGCVGCTGVEAIYHYSALNDLTEDEGTQFNGSIEFDQIMSIPSDGTFKGTLQVVGTGITALSGNWGGVFSDNNDMNTVPGAVGGTLGGNFRDGDGEGAFVGMFVGSTP